MATVTKMYFLFFLMMVMIPTAVICASEDPLQVDFPSVTVHAKENGNFTMMSKGYGDIRVLPGVNETGTVYLEDEDILYIIKIVMSLPPVWAESSPFGYLGEFQGGQKVSIQLEAKDPEGGKITYSLVAGDLPPGISLDPSTGMVKGLAPDAHTTYSFTIRATDIHGKTADNVFRFKAIGSNGCERNTCLHEGVCQDGVGDFHCSCSHPYGGKKCEISSNGCERNTCLHEGVCQDGVGDFHCSCSHPYGGKKCEINCQSHGLGVDQRYKVVSDGQMSAYKTWSNYEAKNGRLYGSGWYGIDSNSWLQIDLGNLTQIHGAQMQGCSSYYYTLSYYLQYSRDGNVFANYTTTSPGQYTLPGYGGTSMYTRLLPQYFEARFVRFVPLQWRSSYKPCMKVELLGCYHVYF